MVIPHRSGKKLANSKSNAMSTRDKVQKLEDSSRTGTDAKSMQDLDYVKSVYLGNTRLVSTSFGSEHPSPSGKTVFWHRLFVEHFFLFFFGLKTGTPNRKH